MKTLPKKLGVASALSLALVGSVATAAPLTQLYFTQFAGWDATAGNSTFNPGSTGLTGLDFANPVAGAPAGSNADMSWNAASNGNSSSINITTFDDVSSPIRLEDDLATVDGDTNADDVPDDLVDAAAWEQGEWWVISTLTQTNAVLDINGSFVPNPLWVADTLANLSIFTDAGRLDLLGADLNSKVTIEFNESFNGVANPAACAGDNPLGTQCDDIYTIAAADFAPISFTRDGYAYDISFQLIPGLSTPSGLPSLVCPNPADVRCAGVTVPPGEIRVFTEEAAVGTSSISVAMRFDVRAVPAPGIVALFGAGVLGAGLAARRRRNAS